MRLLQVALDEDLALYSRFLWTRQIRHRIFEEGGHQVLELAQAEDAEVARRAYDAWRSGELVLAPAGTAAPLPQAAGASILRRAPVILTTIALSVLLYFFFGQARLDQAPLAWFTFTDLRIPGDSLPAVLERLELWRLAGPALLHFSVPHLLFNGAVTWELGRRVEDRLGSLVTLLVLLVLAVCSNVVQFMVANVATFGGLSGVAYGLLGFILVRARLAPGQPAWQLPTGVAVSLLLFLVIFSTGVTETFGLYVANAAHWSGLIAGALLAVVVRERGAAPLDSSGGDS